jgi:hypothetical protein
MASFAMTTEELASATLAAIKARAIELESPLSDEDANALGAMMAGPAPPNVTEQMYSSTMEQIKGLPKDQFSQMLMMAKMMGGGGVDTMAQNMAAAMGAAMGASAEAPAEAKSTNTGGTTTLTSLVTAGYALGKPIAAYKQGDAPEPLEAAANMEAFVAWIKAGESEVVDGIPSSLSPRILVAARFGKEEGDGDDDLWCNLENYGPFSEDREKYKGVLSALSEFQEVCERSGGAFRELMEKDALLFGKIIAFIEGGAWADDNNMKKVALTKMNQLLHDVAAKLSVELSEDDWAVLGRFIEGKVSEQAFENEGDIDKWIDGTGMKNVPAEAFKGIIEMQKGKE